MSVWWLEVEKNELNLWCIEILQKRKMPRQFPQKWLQGQGQWEWRCRPWGQSTRRLAPICASWNCEGRRFPDRNPRWNHQCARLARSNNTPFDGSAWEPFRRRRQSSADRSPCWSHCRRPLWEQPLESKQSPSRKNWVEVRRFVLPARRKLLPTPPPGRRASRWPPRGASLNGGYCPVASLTSHNTEEIDQDDSPLVNEFKRNAEDELGQDVDDQVKDAIEEE